MRHTAPIAFKQANTVLKATTPDVEDLPVFSDGEQVISCWRVPWVRRWRLFFDGRIFLAVKGKTHTPLYVETDIW